MALTAEEQLVQYLTVAILDELNSPLTWNQAERAARRTVCLLVKRGGCKMDDFKDVRDLPIKELRQLPPGNYTITQEQLLALDPKALDPNSYGLAQAKLASLRKTVTSSSESTERTGLSAETVDED